MSALLFPGQGSQIVGMGSEFYEKFDLVKDIFKLADKKLNYPISKMILEGPEGDLQLTKNTQPAILIVSFSIFKVLKEEFGFDFKNFKFFAGHSLGEYSALVCSNALNFEDALYLLHERGKAMQEAVPVGKGSMIAVLGLSIEEVESLISASNEVEGVCEIANDNANGQIIISGELKKVLKFNEILKSKKVKTIPLKVSAPFHCSLMKPAANTMSKKINDTIFNQPTHEIITNVNAQAESKPENLKKFLSDKIYSTGNGEKV